LHYLVLNPEYRALSLGEVDRRFLEHLSVGRHGVPNRHDIISDTEQSKGLHLITSGFAYRYKQLGNGARQIMGFLIPGDLCDLSGWLLGQMDHSVSALGPCEVVVIPLRRLSELIETRPRLAINLWRETALDTAITREWLTSVGRRRAHARLSHLLCEIWWRLHMAGLAHDQSFDFPVTQAEVGDALGLSIVHVNRTLKVLRAEGLISPQSTRIMLLDLPRLKEVAEFDPAYLQVQSQYV
jgi:CRP-like cAMP-binding protein